MKSNKMTITFPTLGRQAWQRNEVVKKEMLLSTRHKKQEAKETEGVHISSVIQGRTENMEPISKYHLKTKEEKKNQTKSQSKQIRWISK